MVERKIPPRLVKKLVRVVRDSKGVKHLWGSANIKEAAKRETILLLYKDLYAVSYNRLAIEVDLGFRLSQHSFTHNAKVIRKALGGWGREQIWFDTWEGWDKLVENSKKVRGLEKVNLWMDSTDIQMAHRDGWTKGGPDFSGKTKKFGQRYQVVQDADGVVQGLWGGYSPKLYDGDWVNIMKEPLSRELFGGHVVADTHYETANKTFKSIGEEESVKFYTPIAKPRGPKKKKGGKGSNNSAEESVGLRVLTKDQETHNKRIASIRGRVEGVFGTIKQKWKCLDGPFREKKEQQNYVVYLAIGVFNWNKRHPQ